MSSDRSMVYTGTRLYHHGKIPNIESMGFP